MARAHGGRAGRRVLFTCSPLAKFTNTHLLHLFCAWFYARVPLSPAGCVWARARVHSRTHSLRDGARAWWAGRQGFAPHALPACHIHQCTFAALFLFVVSRSRASLACGVRVGGVQNLRVCFTHHSLTHSVTASPHVIHTRAHACSRALFPSDPFAHTPCATQHQIT